jgi:ribose-phosphate pyrophosphokinase
MLNFTLLSGSANRPLALATAADLGVELGAAEIERFPDGELHIEVRESLRGRAVYLLQPTAPPVETHLLELLFTADACRRAGAARLTAIVPYFGYARQDRRASGREPVGARVVADLLETVGLERVVAVDLHSTALEGCFRCPLEHLTAVPRLVEAVRSLVSERTVVVAPDLGATKLAERYATALGLPVAIVHKVRLSGEEVRARRVTGEVRDRLPVLVDDMVSTGGTIEAAAAALLEAGALPEITVVATHGLLVGPALERLGKLPLTKLIVSDSVAFAGDPKGTPPVQVISLAPLLAEAVRRLNRDESLSDLLVHA